MDLFFVSFSISSYLGVLGSAKIWTLFRVCAIDLFVPLLFSRDDVSAADVTALLKFALWWNIWRDLGLMLGFPCYVPLPEDLCFLRTSSRN